MKKKILLALSLITINQTQCSFSPLDELLISEEEQFQIACALSESMAANKETEKKAIQPHSNSKKTPFSYRGCFFLTAVQENDLMGIKAFLPLININFQDENGCNALHHALSANKETLNLILSTNIDVNQPNNDGNTAFHCALYESQELFLTLFSKKIRSIDLNIPDSKGYTTLQYAVQNGYRRIVNQILAKKANINHKDTYGDTALHYAIRLENKEIFDDIMRHAPNLNQKNKDGHTSLFVAIKHYKHDPYFIRALLKSKALDTIKDNEGLTPLNYAIKKGFTNIGLMHLLNSRKFYNEPDNKGYTPLHYAVSIKGANESLVRMLLIFGANMEAMAKDGSTPFTVVIEQEKTNLVKLLLEGGANPNRFHKGKFPIHIATKKEDISLVKLLLTKGASINTVTSNGKTPLMIAAKHGNLELIQCLSKHGASLDIQNKSGQTVLDIARVIAQEEYKMMRYKEDSVGDSEEKITTKDKKESKRPVNKFRNIYTTLLELHQEKKKKVKIPEEKEILDCPICCEAFDEDKHLKITPNCCEKKQILCATCMEKMGECPYCRAFF